jgi:hypothetical protein
MLDDPSSAGASGDQRLDCVPQILDRIVLCEIL